MPREIGAIFMGWWGLLPEDEKIMREVLQRLTSVETKIDIVITGRDIAIQAHESASSAHKRLNAIEEEIKDIQEAAKVDSKSNKEEVDQVRITVKAEFEDLRKGIKADFDEIRKNQNWLPKLITSTIITSGVAGLVGFLIATTVGGK
jgi:predicted  nucleic acid-binding Zn-ribbon protein